MSTTQDFNESRSESEWLSAAQAIARENRLYGKPLKRLPSGDHVVFAIGDLHILKIYHDERDCLEREKGALAFIHGRLHFPTPEVTATGVVDGLDYVIISRIPGLSLTRGEFLRLPSRAKHSIIDDLAAGCREIHAIDATGRENDWVEFVEYQVEAFIDLQIGHGVNQQVLEALPAFIERNLRNVPLDSTSFLHGDIHFGNLRFTDENADGRMKIAGLFDLADSRVGFYEYDFTAIGVLMIQGERELQRRFFLEYGYAASDLDEEMRDRLMMLTMLYETADLRRYAIRRDPDAVNYSLERLTREIWSFC